MPSKPAASPNTSPAKTGKQLSNPASTGGAGFSYEARVQAVYLLAMFTGELTLAMPHAKVVELRFQARVHGYHTDDLVCTFLDDSGAKRMALLQAKRDTRAVASDAQFVATLSAAWLDFCNPEKFNRGADRIVLVYETTSGGSLDALRQVANLARGSADAPEFLRKVQAEGFSAQSKRDVLELVMSVISSVAGTAQTEEEVRLFLSHCWVVQHRLGDSHGQETVGYITTIKLILGGDLASQPDLIWADIAQRCTQLNAEGATVTQERLGEYFSPRLVKAFADYRQTGIAAATSTATTEALLGAVPADFELSSATARATEVVVAPLPAAGIGLPNALPNSANKLVSAHLDAINERVKAGRYKDALADLRALGTDQSLLDNHQKARWHLQRGACLWSLGEQADAAADFIRAADLYPDEDKMAAAKVRGLALQEQYEAALSAATVAKARFPESLSVWMAWATAKILSSQPVKLAEFPLAMREEADALQLVAWSKSAQKDWSGAISTALQAIGAKDAGFYARKAALAIVLEAVTENVVTSTFSLLEAHAQSALRTVVQAFEPRSEKLWAVQSPEAQTSAATHLGIASLLLHEPEAALRVVEEAKAQSIAAASLVRVELQALVETRSMAEFKARTLQAIGQLSDDGLVSVAQAAANRGDLEIVERAIEAVPRLQSMRGDLPDTLRAIRWTALWNSGQQEVAQREVEAANLEISQSLPLLIVGTRLLLKSAAPPKLAALMQRAIELVNSGQPEERLLLADLLFDAKRYGEAAAQFRQVLSPNQHGELHNRWLCSLVRSGDIRSAKQLLDSFPHEWIEDEVARSLAIELGSKAGDWALLRRIADEEFQRSPDNASSWLFRHSLDLRTKSMAELQESLSSAPLTLHGSIREQTQLGAEELRLGLKHEGMRRLYRMRRLNASNVESASCLFVAFVSVPELLPDMEESLEHVKPGCHVVLVDQVGQQTNVTLDPRGIEDLPVTTEFQQPSAREVAPLLNKRVGDEVSVEGPFGSARTYRIQSIKSAYRRLMELAQEEMQKSFPPVPGIEMMQVRHGPEGADFSQMIGPLTRQSGQVRQAFAAYRSAHLTLGVLALALGRDTIDLVRGWGFPSEDVRLRVCLGTSEERAQALSLLEEAQAEYVVDAATLAEIALLQAEAALGVLGKLYVTTHTHDKVMRALDESKRDRSSGKLFESEGKLGFIEFTEEQHARNTAQLQRIADLMTSCCEVVPVYGPDAVPEELVKLLQLLPDEDRAVLLLAAERNMRLFSLDFRLRTIASLAGIQGVWPQVVLMRAADRGFVTAIDYTRAIVSMFMGERSFVSISANELLFICRQGTTSLRSGISKFMQQLRDPEADYNSAVLICREFFQRSLFQAYASFGAVAELLKHTVEALLRHPQAGGNVPMQLVEVFDRISATELQRQYFASAIREGIQWAAQPPLDRSIRIQVLMCGVTPWLTRADESEEPPEASKVLEAHRDDSQRIAGEASEVVYMADTGILEQARTSG